MTAGDWIPFGGDPAPGDPQAAATLAAIFGDVAGTGSQALSALHAMARHADGSIWRGPAADAFGIHLAKTPGQLQQMVTSYATASQAMRAFAAVLSSLQEQAVGLLPQLQAAQEQVSSAEAAGATAAAGQATTAAETHVAQAKDQLAALLGEVEQIRGESRAAAARCRAGLERSHAEGIQNESWWQEALDDATSVLGEVVKWAGVVLVVIAIVVLIAAFPEITGPLLLFFADAGEALLAGLAAGGEAFGGVALESAGEALAEGGTTELAGAGTATVTEAGATGLEAGGLEGTQVGELSLNDAGQVEETFTEADSTSSTTARIAEQWKTLGENSWWKSASWAMKGLVGLKTAADADRYFQYGESDTRGDLIGDGIDDVLGAADLAGDTALGARIGIVQGVGTEAEAGTRITNILGEDGELTTIKVSYTAVTPNAVDVNLASLPDPPFTLAGATGHGTDWIGQLVSEALAGRDGAGVTHHVAFRGAG